MCGVCVWWGAGTCCDLSIKTQEFLLSFHCVSPNDQTEVNFGGKYIYLMSHLAGLYRDFPLELAIAFGKQMLIVYYVDILLSTFSLNALLINTQIAICILYKIFNVQT